MEEQQDKKKKEVPIFSYFLLVTLVASIFNFLTPERGEFTLKDTAIVLATGALYYITKKNNV